MNKMSTTKMVQLYESGESIRQIAVQAKMSYAGVHNRLKTARVEFRPPGGSNRKGSKKDPTAHLLGAPLRRFQ